MARLVEDGDGAVLVDAGNDAAVGGLAGRVDAGELGAKVAEDASKETEAVGNDDEDALGVAVVGDALLLVDGDVGQDDDLVLVELGVVIEAIGSVSKGRGASSRQAGFAYLGDSWSLTGT